MFDNVAMQTTLPASDLERAKRWYEETLGLTPARESEFGGAEYEAGGSAFLIYESQFAGTNQATAAGFRVDNFDEAVDHLRSRGVEFEHVDFGEMGSTVDGVISSPDGEKAAWFKDSEGNILALSTM
jgi:catechol 2,3-dioxygenase-like lactoylglutathione lyase family enzyme